MKTTRSNAALRGFTLVELLVVIAVIAILAGLLLTAMPGIKNAAVKKRVKAELQMVAIAIDNYKLKLGSYPPDNTGNYSRNALFYELVGCTRSNNGQTFTPMDGSPAVTDVVLNAQTGNRGIMNASTGSSNSDEGRVAQSFLKDLKPTQYVDSGVRRLGVAVDGPSAAMAGALTLFYYNSSNPTHNPNSYDLWVDIIVGGKTNRVNNWSANPEIL